MALGSGGVVCGHGVDLRSVGGGGGENLLFVRFPVGVDHRSVGAKAGTTFLLDVTLLLAETANNGLGLTVVAIPVESAKVRPERRLALPEADGVDSLELLLGEVLFFLIGDRLVTGIGGGDGGNGTASFVVLDDLHLLSITHALVEGGLSCLP